ncbi:MAG: hypothetical protein NVS3B26_23950 [Mycobacteriales bacterium]
MARSRAIAGRALARIDRLLIGQPPLRTGSILLLLIAATLVAAHLPAAFPLTVVTGAAVAAVSGLWTGPTARAMWCLAAAGATAPLAAPSASAGASVLAAMVLLWLLAAAIGRLGVLMTEVQQSAVRRFGERDELDRQSRAQRERLAGHVEYLTHHDLLTGLVNRSALQAHIHQLAASQVPTGLLLISGAGFTLANETLGPVVGDELLAALARRLTSRSRDSDLVGRVGGDEFAVVLPGLTAEHVPQVTKRLLSAFTDPFTVGAHVVPLHARAGIALDDGSFLGGAPELLRQAGQAARRAAVDGPANVFNAQTTAQAQAAHELESDLIRGLEREEFFLLYQPLVSTLTGAIESVEALVRWQHPDRGLVPPDQFIGAAERSGHIVPLGLSVLRMAVQQLRQWSAAGAPYLTVAVNVSARQLVEVDFVEQVRRVLWGSGVDPGRIVLELTESLLVEDGDAAIAVLWQLRALGVRLAIDDFGTGYSSLARLGELPIDEMKIDKSFIDRLGAPQNETTALVTAAIAMGHGLRLTVVAEGIETPAQAAQLQALGCDLLQGYLLGRPQKPEDITPQLHARLLPELGIIPAPRPAGATDAAGVMYVPSLMPYGAN